MSPEWTKHGKGQQFPCFVLTIKHNTMRVAIESVNATSQQENEHIINKVMPTIEGITRIEEAYNSVAQAILPTLWKCGRGSGHIWVSNWNNERLMLITESRTTL